MRTMTRASRILTRIAAHAGALLLLATVTMPALACSPTPTASATTTESEPADHSARPADEVETDSSENQADDATIGEDIDDAWIVTKIKAKLTADPEINPFNIDVDAVQGVVTLSGTVEKGIARDEAEKLALDTKGVREVHNEIKVSAS